MISALVPLTIIPSAFADYHEITVQPIPNSGSRIICGESLNVDCYAPNPITIDIGGKVIFSNTDAEPHFFTSGQIGDNEIGLDFDSGLLNPNEIFIWNPKVVGDFPYFCPIHPWMQGLIIVQSEPSDQEPQEKIEETSTALTTDVEKVNAEYDALEIDPEPKLTDEEPITEKQLCAPGTQLINGVCMAPIDTQLDSESNVSLEKMIIQVLHDFKKTIINVICESIIVLLC